MLAALNFVKGAVAKKDWQPSLTHFRIHAGRVLGYNGIVALSSPIDLDIDAVPEAIPFVRAIERCESDTTVVHMTPARRLSLRSGAFQAYIKCLEDSELLDSILPEGERVEFAGEAIVALRALYPFIGTDASRDWCNGVLLRGHSAFATNNVVIVERWIGSALPEVNLPSVAIRELLRINEEPVAVTISDRSATFHFVGDRWMRTQLLSTGWPDVSRILDLPFESHAVPAGLFDAIEKIVPFVEDDGRVYFRPNRIATHGQGEDGAAVSIEGTPQSGAFHHRQLLLLKDVVTTIDFKLPPMPSGFRGHKLRGAIIGMRDA